VRWTAEQIRELIERYEAGSQRYDDLIGLLGVTLMLMFGFRIQRSLGNLTSYRLIDLSI
jgi:hypothetical protein